MSETKAKPRTPWVSSRHEFVTVEKASERLGIPPLTIRKWIERHEVAKRQVDKGRFVYDFEHLADLEGKARERKAKRES